MRILYVTYQRYRSSGVSVWCVEMCEKLLEMGHFVKLALQEPDYRDPYPVKHEELLTTTDEAIAGFDVAHWDLVHINGVWNWPYHQIATLARNRGIPIVWSPHGSLTPWAMGHKHMKKLLAWFLYQKRDLKRASVLHVTAQSEVEDMRQLGLKDAISVLPLGVNLRWTDEELCNLKARNKRNRILFVSRIHPKKGVDNLIKAWAKLKRECPSLILGWGLDIVGECDFKGYLDELKSLAKAADVSDDVIFHGPLYGDRKENAYATSQLFVLPSHSENFGSVVVEALANGTPVITTKGTPWKELEENNCGWWIDVGVDSLFDALRDALAKGVVALQSMGANGRALVRRRYVWKAVAAQMEKVYMRFGGTWQKSN